uniref:Opsin n=1 Tax=Branchiostoma belcheri TaxID=7741 RepID=Q868F9_BRABE|nr:opsin [Branchiostoma belcheri]
MSSNLTNVSLVANRTDQTELSPTDVTMQLIFGSMMLVFGLIGVVGNVVALYAFCRTRSLRRPKNYVVANLCLTDMFVCLVYCPIVVSRSFSHGFPSKESCIVEGFMVGVGSIASICSLAAIAVERYLSVTQPLKSLTILTQRKLLVAVLTVWVYSLLLAFPPLVGWGRYVREETYISCTFDYLSTDDATRAYVITLVMGAFGFPLLTIAYCYIRVFTTARKHAEERKFMSPLKRPESRTEIKTAVTACVITTSFCLCWCPYAVVATLGISGVSVQQQTVFSAALLAKLTVIINPIVYVLSIPNFRKALFAQEREKYASEDVVLTSLPGKTRRMKKVERSQSSNSNVVIEVKESSMAYSTSRESCLLSRAATKRLAGKTKSIVDLVDEFGLQETAPHKESLV